MLSVRPLVPPTRLRPSQPTMSPCCSRAFPKDGGRRFVVPQRGVVEVDEAQPGGGQERAGRRQRVRMRREPHARIRSRNDSETAPPAQAETTGSGRTSARSSSFRGGSATPAPTGASRSASGPIVEPVQSTYNLPQISGSETRSGSRRLRRARAARPAGQRHAGALTVMSDADIGVVGLAVMARTWCSTWRAMGTGSRCTTGPPRRSMRSSRGARPAGPSPARSRRRSWSRSSPDRGG